MRNVKVYVISETVKAVAGNFVEFYERAVPDAHIYTRDASGFSEHDDEVALKADPVRLPLPVHRYRDADGAETFFALRPDVAELLATPASLDVVARARSEAREASARRDAANTAALNAISKSRALQARVDAWKSLPWFSRVWRALRREL